MMYRLKEILAIWWYIHSFKNGFSWLEGGPKSFSLFQRYFLIADCVSETRATIDPTQSAFNIVNHQNAPYKVFTPQNTRRIEPENSIYPTILGRTDSKKENSGVGHEKQDDTLHAGQPFLQHQIASSLWKCLFLFKDHGHHSDPLQLPRVKG